MNSNRISSSITAALLVLFAAPALAGPLGWETTNEEQIFRNNTWIFGINFRVNTAISINGLGYYDDRGNGFLDNHEVGLYTSTGTLLTSTTVTSADALVGHFRVGDIAPIVLAPGDYRVVGANLNDLYVYGSNTANLVVDSNITYLGDAYSQGSTLTFLTNPSFVNDTPWGFWGPNIRIGSNGVPEPASLALLGIGLAGLGAMRRRKTV